ncbi:hypothetical protein MPER_06498 [Moniliophthora perniciosa FA553]|nr:hypothetical protein MPER_06498 [Moniliophthora perniciosa FA553]
MDNLESAGLGGDQELLHLMLRLLIKKHGISAMPPSLFLNDIVREGIHPCGGGSYAVLRIHLEADERKREKVVLAFCEEALVWTRLCHPNILPLLGVNVTEFAPAFCFIAWMGDGEFMWYLKRTPDHNRLQIVWFD